MPVITAELSVSGSQGSLRQLGPTELLDRAFYLLRSGPLSRVGKALLASAPLATVCLGLYYLEVIERVRTLRPVFALLLTAAFVFRAALVSHLARDLVRELRPSLPMPLPGTREFPKVASIAAVAGLGLWAWLWPLGWLAQFSPYAMIALVPLLALRGGIAPSWLARARCGGEGGLRAWGLASDDAAGARASLVFVELMLLLGLVGAFANLFALTALLLVLSHAVLGLDVAFVSAFLSADNDFVAYGLFGVCLCAFDPLRAAVSACVFADARSRKDGADLHAAVDALLTATAPNTSGATRASRDGGAATRGVALVFLLLSAAVPLRAQDHGESSQSRDPAVVLQRDVEIRAAVERILARREFAENAPVGARSFETWLRELLERWFSDELDEQEEHEPLRVALPEVSPWLVMAVIFGLLLVAIAYVSWEARSRAVPAPAAAGPPREVRLSERPAPLLISDARALAAAGDFAAALRALYAATLAALDRARLIQFDPAKTNGHYLRVMPAGSLRDAFTAFTRMFDRKWYGREAVSRTDFERGLELAEHICQSEIRKP